MLERQVLRPLWAARWTVITVVALLVVWPRGHHTHVIERAPTAIDKAETAVVPEPCSGPEPEPELAPETKPEPEMAPEPEPKSEAEAEAEAGWPKTPMLSACSLIRNDNCPGFPAMSRNKRLVAWVAVDLDGEVHVHLVRLQSDPTDQTE